MITKIGVIYEDRTSLGFLRGLRDRLKCEADLIDPPGGVPRAPRMPSTGARRAWRYFQKRGVDMVVRFTDADRDRWQGLRRDELNSVPDEARSMWICGVAVNNVEEWLCLDEAHLATVLRVPSEDLQDPEHRTGRIKSALTRLSREHGRDKSEVVARIVRRAPREVFGRWLRADDALQRFYTDCRAAARRARCEKPNELEVSEDE